MLEPLWQIQGALIQAHIRSRHFGVLQHHFNSNSLWPTHKVLSRMSYKRYQVIWRNINLVKPDEGDDDGDKTDRDDEGEDTEDDDSSQPPDERWFAKAAPIIDLVNETSKKVCKYRAFCVSIDEQMKEFKGHSGRTFRMKNKPISEGYKFWAICCANSGFCYDYIPAARTRKEERSSTRSYWYLGNFPERIETICCSDRWTTFSLCPRIFQEQGQ